MGATGLVLMAACLAVPVAAQAAPSYTGPQEVRIGDPLRKTLLDALRTVAEEDLGQPLLFVVDALRVQGRWAFAIIHPRTPAGGAIDFRLTRYAHRLEAGVLDGDATYVLLRKNGTQWTVRDYVIGPTDVAFADWPVVYGAPAALMGLPRQTAVTTILSDRRSAKAR
ncbi:hypothetical protein BH10PSE13_BH10PSE13_06670 [soil metagenome]